MTIYLDEYKTFDSKQELNYNVSMHEKAHYDVLNVTDRNILRLIARYSVKYAGASHLKTQTIADNTDVSVRTVRRILKRLEALGIIRRISMTRPKSGGSGANIMQILPYTSERMTDREVTNKARHTTDKDDNNATEPLRKRQVPYYVLESVGIDSVESLDANNTDVIRNNIPKALYEILSPYFRGKELRKYVGIIFRGKTSKVKLEPNIGAFKACIVDCIRRYKDGAVRGLEGYVYASIRRLSRRLFLGV